MPVPTDKLADDIDGMRADVVTLRTETTAGFEKMRAELVDLRVETKDDLREYLAEAREDIGDIRTDLAPLQGDFRELRAEVRVVIGLLKWIGGAVVISLMTQAAAAIWYAAKLDSRVGGHEQRIERLERSSDARLPGPVSAK